MLTAEYRLSAKLRALAALFRQSGSTERDAVTMNAVELDGLAFVVEDIADGIDVCRDNATD